MYEEYIVHEKSAIYCSDDMFQYMWDFSSRIDSTPNPLNSKYMIKRKQCTFGAEYKFAGQTSKRIQEEHWPSLVNIVLSDANTRSGSNIYNVAHANWYPDGTSGLDPHSDNENDMIQNKDIYSYTFLSQPGNPRGFQIYENKEQVGQIFLDHGDLIIMKAGMQQLYKHGVKRSAANKYKNLKRINLTVRAWTN
jgi:alkylated DNA repair dioxygenase AlkB